MKLAAPLALIALVGVAGCATFKESRINPANWFGKSQLEETVDPATIVEAAGDPRPFVDQIVSMSVERTIGGAILRATGLPETQGFYYAELVEANGGVPQDGVLSFDFRIVPPTGFERQSTQASREVIAGTFLTNADLAGVRSIRVVGARNARVARR